MHFAMRTEYSGLFWGGSSQTLEIRFVDKYWLLHVVFRQHDKEPYDPAKFPEEATMAGPICI